MPVENPTVFLTQFTWNGSTYNATSGGTIGMRYTHDSRMAEDRVADQLYPTFVVPVQKNLRVTLMLRKVKRTEELGAASSNLVCTLSNGGATETITFATMKIESISGNQPIGAVGDSDISFVHQSADGSAIPVT